MADWNKYFKRPSWIPRWLNIPLLIFAGFIVIKQNEDSARIYDAKVRELNTDHETLERIVREQYGMKRVNEDVYVTDIP